MTDIGFTTEQQADHDYRRWVHQFEHHLGQIPDVLSMLVTLAQPTIGVSRGGSRFDRLQITGGNEHRDLGDTIDETLTRDAGYLWGLLTGYAAAVWERAEDTRQNAPDLAGGALTSPSTAKDAALLTVGWLIHHAPTAHTLALTEDERELFSTVRRLKAVHGIHPHPRPGMCDTCGRHKVTWDYVDTRGGGVARVGVCRSCGETFTQQIEEGTEMTEPTNHADGGPDE
ncbi:hypothetical protein [Microbacterium sp. 5K110]|uniref:hypothetical protein n=1 Tax=Microbacterium sp. 5K110 TaxID=2578104 RepID=UPI0010FE8858|nr:hypothetical protein [Microbacterium sp. 5K110]TLF33250.1 hypothetical protein FE256_03920 [Microbacterium sp. 5K110]